MVDIPMHYGYIGRPSRRARRAIDPAAPGSRGCVPVCRQAIHQVVLVLGNQDARATANVLLLSLARLEIPAGLLTVLSLTRIHLASPSIIDSWEPRANLLRDVLDVVRACEPTLAATNNAANQHATSGRANEDGDLSDHVNVIEIDGLSNHANETEIGDLRDHVNVIETNDLDDYANVIETDARSDHM
ncbi:hypothetical protein C6341_g21355 [Phytophthora cactorum]|nr:hypothetical protein C6341_g21355 [Phytophthora cactorum]